MGRKPSGDSRIELISPTDQSYAISYRSVVQFNAVLQFCVDTLSSRDIYQPVAEGPESINKFMSSVQSLGNVKMKFVRAFSIEEMRKMV